MIVKTELMEVRGKEEKTSQKGNPYIIVRAEDETGKLVELCDKDTERFDYYKKGVQGYFSLLINLGRYTNIEIKDFRIQDEK